VGVVVAAEVAAVEVVAAEVEVVEAEAAAHRLTRASGHENR